MNLIKSQEKEPYETYIVIKASSEKIRNIILKWITYKDFINLLIKNQLISYLKHK